MVPDDQAGYLSTLEASIGSADAKTLRALVSELFLITFDRSPDRTLRRRCLRIGRGCLSQSQEVTIATILAEIDRFEQVSGRATAPSSALVCLEWVNMCISFESSDMAFLEKLILYQALLLDVCCSETAKVGIRNSASRQVRSILKARMESRSKSLDIVQKYLEILTGPSSSGRHAVIIGEIVLLSHKDIEHWNVVVSCKTRLLEFYIQNFLSSKQIVPANSCQGLNPILSLVISNEDITDTLLPLMVKALLRAPEIVADPVLTAFCSSARPGDVETEKLLVDGLTRPLISTFKSSNLSTRERGLRALIALQKRSVAHTALVVEELAKCYTGERPGIDQRVTIAECLQRLTFTEAVAKSSLTSILSLLAKESNEPASLNLISAVWKVTQKISAPEDIANSPLIAATRKGLLERKASIRNHWICSLASFLLLELKSGAAMSLVETLRDTLISLWHADTKVPLQSLQSGLLAGTYGLTTILLLAVKQPSIGKEVSIVISFRN